MNRLIACQTRLYRQTGTYPDELAVAIPRWECLLHAIMAGRSTPRDIGFIQKRGRSLSPAADALLRAIRRSRRRTA